MQIPVETAAFFRPVQCEPRAPVQRLTRPAQVQAREAEENQHQGARAGDLATGLADGQKTVQLQHQAEEILACGIALIGAGVGVDIAQLAAPLARWRGEEHAGGTVAVNAHPQHRHLLAFAGFDSAYQFGGRQYAAVELLDLEYRGVEQVQQLVLKRHGRTGDAHQGQH